MFLPKVTQLASQGAGLGVRGQMSLKGMTLSLSSMRLISVVACQLITLALHSSRSLWARTFLSPLLRQNSFWNLSNSASGDTLHGAPGG